VLGTSTGHGGASADRDAVLLPVMTLADVDPVHFGIVMMLNLGIVLITPPVGTVLLVGCARSSTRHGTSGRSGQPC
jgi:TRAP-type C4-dicarboxylate transport system permease large subunit